MGNNFFLKHLVWYCLVGNLVSPLLDGLDNLLDDGCLVHNLGGGPGVGGGGSGVGDGSGGVSVAVGGSGGGIAVGGSRGSIAVCGGRGVGQVGVGAAVVEAVGVGQDGIGGTRDGGNSAGENNLKDGSALFRLIDYRSFRVYLIELKSTQICFFSS